MELINRNVQKQLLVATLDIIDDFCRKNNISYYLLGGTLIGAVRHKGFIPWDDDIDICMLRNDYNRFIHEFSDSSGRYELLAFENDENWYLPTAKVIDTNTFLSEDVPGAKDIGLFVDIFPIDNCPGEYNTSCKFANSLNIYRQMLTYKNLGYSKNRYRVKNAILRVLHGVLKPVSKKWLVEQITCKASKYCDGDDNCKFVGELTNMPYGCREIYEKEWFKQTVELEFEGRKYWAPVGYHNVLTMCFGDYMKLPPAEQQISHHENKVYWKESI